MDNTNEHYNNLINILNDKNIDEENIILTFKDITFNNIIELIGLGPEDIKILTSYLIFNTNKITSQEFILLKILVHIKFLINTNLSKDIVNAIDELINK
jgi:hypothetical protein